MPTRIQPSMDLQLTPSGMGPAMMRLDVGVAQPPLLSEILAEMVTTPPATIPATTRTRWQRIWTVLNMDVGDVWRLVINRYRHWRH